MVLGASLNKTSKLNSTLNVGLDWNNVNVTEDIDFTDFETWK